MWQHGLLLISMFLMSVVFLLQVFLDPFEEELLAQRKAERHRQSAEDSEVCITQREEKKML